MAYQKQDFKDGLVLKAEHLNHIEEGIVQLVTAVNELSRNQSGGSSDSGGSTGECNIRRIESNINGAPLVNFRDIDSGNYILYGYFSPYENSDISISADNSLVSVIWKNAGSHLICLDPLNAKIVFFEILVDESAEKGFTYNRTIIPLLDLYALLERSSSATIGYANLLAENWVGENNLYSQVVNIDGVTENSQVDLTPSVEQLVVFYEKDLTFVTENVDGVVTVYAIGQKPENDYTIQVTITEVAV